MTNKFDKFPTDNGPVDTRFLETQVVKDGVTCDIYAFEDDDSKDLAIITVQKGYSTPLQRVILGTKTIEGFMSGAGKLIVKSIDETVQTYDFPSSERQEVAVEIGQIMQWHADGDTDLVFYEICEPPYEGGRFENLPE